MYSPPADGHSLPSCAYDIAPARARHPPATQRASIAPGDGTSLAMMAGVVKMPTPITFDTISATPSLTRNEWRSWLRIVAAAESPGAVAALESELRAEVITVFCGILSPL